MKTKKFVFDDEKPPIIYRPGTSDEAIINSVLINQQEYSFPAFDAKLVFDIGANIGVVSVILAMVYPNAKIMAFEPVKENFDLLKLNAEHYPNIKPLHCALGKKYEKKRIFKSDDKTNLGGFSTHIKAEEGEEISIVRTSVICQELGVPDVVKIDVEGAEADILSDIPNIQKVKWIAGELHGVDDYALLGFLSKHFHLGHGRRFGDKVWHFHAVSKSWTDFGLDPSLQ